MSEWIDWRGGECPVPLGVHLDVRFRDGDSHEGKNCAEAYHWGHLGQGVEPDGFYSDADIVAYRIAEAK